MTWVWERERRFPGSRLGKVGICLVQLVRWRGFLFFWFIFGHAVFGALLGVQVDGQMLESGALESFGQGVTESC